MLFTATKMLIDGTIVNDSSPFTKAALHFLKLITSTHDIISILVIIRSHVGVALYFHGLSIIPISKYMYIYILFSNLHIYIIFSNLHIDSILNFLIKLC